MWVWVWRGLGVVEGRVSRKEASRPPLTLPSTVLMGIPSLILLLTLLLLRLVLLEAITQALLPRRCTSPRCCPQVDSRGTPLCHSLQLALDASFRGVRVGHSVALGSVRRICGICVHHRRRVAVR